MFREVFFGACTLGGANTSPVGWKKTKPEWGFRIQIYLPTWRKRLQMSQEGRKGEKKAKLPVLIFTQQSGEAAKRSSCTDSSARTSVAPSRRPRLIDFELALHLGLISYLHPTEVRTNAEEPYFTRLISNVKKIKTCQRNYDSRPRRLSGLNSPAPRPPWILRLRSSRRRPHHSRIRSVVHLALRLPVRAPTEVFF